MIDEWRLFIQMPNRHPVSTVKFSLWAAKEAQERYEYIHGIVSWIERQALVMEV